MSTPSGREHRLDWTEPAAPAVVETHSAVVVLVGDRAYKMKRPVDLGFLDFTTREARLAACRREVELNRRLAPDVYLGVVDVVDADGTPCDHVVVMRRMPEDRRLSTLVRDGADVGVCVREVARTVAAFHASAEVDPARFRHARRQALRENWDDNFHAIRRFVPAVVPDDEFRAVRRLAHRYLEGRGPLFESRIEDGRARDGHGDLLADDIFCLDDGPRILDCLDFADRYRYGDVLLDAAFLAMDLERLGAPERAAAFLDLWREFLGDSYPESLADHYVAYRAHVRAKVACLRTADGDDAARRARRLHRLCRSHLETARVRLVLVGGLPGTGKTTVATGLSDRCGWSLLRSDEVRKDLAGRGHTEPVPAADRADLYGDEMTQATYRALLERAGTLLAMGESVVLDATWRDAQRRAEAAALARETSSDLVQLRCDAPEEVAAERLRRRTGDASDATPAVLREIASVADPWPDATVLDTTRPEATTLRAAAAAAGEPA